MNLTDFLNRLEGVRGHGGQYMAKCPAHQDSKPSLSIGLGADNRILLKCQAGCATEDVVASLGLEQRDLFAELRPGDVFPTYDAPKNNSRSPVVATYDFTDDNGQLIAQKLRRQDKSFTWRRPDGNGGWIYNRKGVPHRLFVAGKLEGCIEVTEGEKDALTLHSLGFDAASGADGAGPGKWRKEYTEQLRGLHVCVFQDNDRVGMEYAAETCNALHGVAASVRLLDLSKVWPEIPEHGDVTDLVTTFGPEAAAEKIATLMSTTKEWEPAAENEKKSILSCFKTLDDFQEEEASWLVPGWIPEGQITLMAADGGVGKTTLWCDVIAALSNGTNCLLDPPGYTRAPAKVVFLTTEDSVRKKLRRKLRLMGANMQNIITPDFVGDKSGLLHKLKFGSPELEEVLRHFKPIFCTFDPVQGFIPPRVNMGSRNEMRDCMAPLISLGEEIGTTSLVICHTNKRKGAFGRDRIADSADLWDIARSVLMAGFTEEQGIRYLTNEKNNYAELQETILFSIDQDGQLHKEGTSWKRDKEYIQDADAAKSAPKREDTKGYIIKTLGDAGGIMATSELDAKAKQAGYSFTSVRRAKQDLKRENTVRYYSVGGGTNKVWYIQLLPMAPIETDFVELPPDEPVPF